MKSVINISNVLKLVFKILHYKKINYVLFLYKHKLTKLIKKI